MKVSIVMGSKSDLPVLEKTISTLKDFGVELEARVLSAHRTADKAAEFAAGARGRGVDVIIAAAGKAAHLAGVMAGHTIIPVIGLPIKSSTMDGLDSLLSTVQMPEGIPVATVAINGGINAALLALQILAVSDQGLAGKLEDYRRDMEKKVLAADEELQREVAKW